MFFFLSLMNSINLCFVWWSSLVSGCCCCLVATNTLRTGQTSLGGMKHTTPGLWSGDQPQYLQQWEAFMVQWNLSALRVSRVYWKHKINTKNPLCIFYIFQHDTIFYTYCDRAGGCEGGQNKFHKNTGWEIERCLWCNLRNVDITVHQHRPQSMCWWQPTGPAQTTFVFIVTTRRMLINMRGGGTTRYHHIRTLQTNITLCSTAPGYDITLIREGHYHRVLWPRKNLLFYYT